MRVFILSLPDSRQRRLSALRLIQPTGMPFEIVDGVEGTKLGWEKLLHDPSVKDWMKLGEVGCYLGHLRILQRVVDYGLPYACVLEDDFCFEADPDYGLTEIETQLPKPFHYIHLQRDLGINEKLQVVGRQGSFLRIRETPYCTTGYIVERSLAKYILAHEANCRMQIDHLYAELSHRGQFYQPQKPLIGINPNLPSDIQRHG